MLISVFLVEDNLKIRENLIPALAELGAASVMATAESEDEAIGWLAQHKGQWDLAVVDHALVGYRLHGRGRGPRIRQVH